MSKLNKIASEDNLIIKEKLPLPYVFYPGFYGTFFGFKKDINSELYLCSCSKEAVENYIKLRLKCKQSYNSDSSRDFILDSMHFPTQLVSDLINKELKQDLNIIKHINFKDKICHECNRIPPSLIYCASVYGTKFVQKHGWYINKKFFEYGIYNGNVIDDLCSNELLALLKERNKINQLAYTFRLKNKFLEANEIQKKADKISRKIYKVVENEVRLRFGYKKIGEKWRNETRLYYIVKKLYSNKKILRHFRPDFLNGLELDVFIEDFSLGIEYQGIQHFQPIKHWGGLEALKKTQFRDAQKKELCNKNNIKLIYFYYNENLTEELVKTRIENCTYIFLHKNI